MNLSSLRRTRCVHVISVGLVAMFVLVWHSSMQPQHARELELETRIAELQQRHKAELAQLQEVQQQSALNRARAAKEDRETLLRVKQEAREAEARVVETRNALWEGRNQLRSFDDQISHLTKLLQQCQTSQLQVADDSMLPPLQSPSAPNSSSTGINNVLTCTVHGDIAGVLRGTATCAGQFMWQGEYYFDLGPCSA